MRGVYELQVASYPSLCTHTSEYVHRDIHRCTHRLYQTDPVRLVQATLKGHNDAFAALREGNRKCPN